MLFQKKTWLWTFSALNSNWHLFLFLILRDLLVWDLVGGAPEQISRILCGQSGVSRMSNLVVKRSNQVATGQQSRANDMPTLPEYEIADSKPPRSIEILLTELPNL